MRETSSRVELAFPAKYQLSEGGKLKLERLSETHTFEDLNGEDAYHLCRQLAAPFDVENWCSRYPGKRDHCEQFIQYCLNEKLVVWSHGNFHVSGPRMAEFLGTLYKAMNAELFSHKLWTSLVDGTASDELVRGWVLETYFFIHGANARMPMAISHCTRADIRKVLQEHFREEWDHYKFFADSVSSVGLDIDKMNRRGPIIGTRAVMWAARRIARTDELAYVACSGLLESTGTDAARGRLFYKTVQENYRHISPSFASPMLKHVDLDEQYAHGSVTDEIFAAVEGIAADRAALILSCLQDFKDTLVLWFDEIIRVYDRRIQHPML